ncbi:MAG: hypothetical protein CVT79_18600, partial [Alphaproteobacteria bacterium HGW-Alphaproteobacteria-18]
MKTFTLAPSTALARYDYLSGLSMDRWAWEYLRRNPRFRRDYALCADLGPSESMAPCAPIRMLKSRAEQRLAGR